MAIPGRPRAPSRCVRAFNDCRFFIHLSIRSFAEAVVSKHGQSGEQAMLFPSSQIAFRCMEFIKSSAEEIGSLRVLDLVLNHPIAQTGDDRDSITAVAAVLMPSSCFSTATKFWQHSGEGISSRRAEAFQKAFVEGHLKLRSGTATASQGPTLASKGPRRYQRKAPLEIEYETETKTGEESTSSDAVDPVQFVEERFGRNLDPSLTRNAKLAIRRRIAGSLTSNVAPEEAIVLPDVVGQEGNNNRFVSVDDVYLYPCGMSAIFNTHRSLIRARGSMKSIMFGYAYLMSRLSDSEFARFPYIDTLKILEKFGPGCIFYGEGSSTELDDLEGRCKFGERFLALFCEFPGNPLLRTPDLSRIRLLADQYDFAVVVDETIGNFLNVHVLPAADVVVSSLTKVFSGDSNVMGGRQVDIISLRTRN